MDQYGVKGNLIHICKTGENHSGNPEGDDIIRSNKGTGWIEICEIFRFIGPSQRREGPQCRGKPCVQRIRILRHMTAAFGTSLNFFRRNLQMTACFVVTIICRNAVSPPQLTGNAPVTNIFHPVEIVFLESLGNKLDFSTAYRLNSRFCKGFHFHKPLQTHPRLHCSVAAVARAYIMAMIFNPQQISALVQVLHNRTAGVIPIHSSICRIILCNLCIRCHHNGHVQVMPATNLKVVRVMGRRNFYTSCSKIPFHIFIGNQRDFTSYQRKNQHLSHQIFIPLVRRMYRNCRICQKGFRSGRCDFYKSAAIRKGIPNVPEMTCLLLMLNFRIGNGCKAFRTPVDNPLAPVN